MVAQRASHVAAPLPIRLVDCYETTWWSSCEPQRLPLDEGRSGYQAPSWSLDGEVTCMERSRLAAWRAPAIFGPIDTLDQEAPCVTYGRWRNRHKRKEGEQAPAERIPCPVDKRSWLERHQEALPLLLRAAPSHWYAVQSPAGGLEDGWEQPLAPQNGSVLDWDLAVPPLRIGYQVSCPCWL